jgi:hypothetical protein
MNARLLTNWLTNVLIKTAQKIFREMSWFRKNSRSDWIFSSAMGDEKKYGGIS